MDDREVFFSVVEANGFSAAARRLETTPASVSRQVKALEQAHFALAMESPGYRDEAIYTAQVYSVALGGGMSSRLFQEIRENRGLCYTIFAQTGAYSDSGLLTIYAGTSWASNAVRRATVPRSGSCRAGTTATGWRLTLASSARTIKTTVSVTSANWISAVA